MVHLPTDGQARAGGSSGRGNAPHQSSALSSLHNYTMQQQFNHQHGVIHHEPSSSESTSGSPQDVIPAVAPVKPERPPRPMNAWLLFRNAQVKILQNQNPEEKQAQGQLSKIIAELWKSAAPETKLEYENLAREKKAEHARMYPDYRYTPREKPAKGRRRASGQKAQPVPATLDLPRRSSANSSSSSGASARPRQSQTQGYHPYAQRSNPNSTLPPIDTSHATNSWQSTSSLSVNGAYPLQDWRPAYAAATNGTSPSTLSSAEERQPYQNNGGPVSAPLDYSGRSPSEMMRQGYRAEEQSPYAQTHQYSPSWPSASSSNSHHQQQQLPFADQGFTEQHARHHTYPGASSLAPADPIPTFEYSLYRAPDSSYAPPTFQHPPSPAASSSFYPNQTPYQPQFSFNESAMFPPPPAPPLNSTRTQDHINPREYERNSLPEEEVWRTERRAMYNSYEPQQHQQQQHQ